MIRIKFMVSGSGPAMLDLRTASGTRRMLVSKQEDIVMQPGDSIECIMGTATVFINPGTSTPAYVLTSQPPLHKPGKFVKELVLTENVFLPKLRGTPFVAGDIGNVNSGGTHTTR